MRILFRMWRSQTLKLTKVSTLCRLPYHMKMTSIVQNNTVQTDLLFRSTVIRCVGGISMSLLSKKVVVRSCINPYDQSDKLYEQVL